MDILCVLMYRMEEKADLFADAVEMDCSALCSTG